MKEERMITLTVDNTEQTCQHGCTYASLAERMYPERKGKILLAQEDGRLRELHHKAVEGARVRFLTIKDSDGYSAYQRSLLHLLFCAVTELYGETEDYEISVHFAVSKGIYCTTGRPEVITDEFIEAVRAKMEQIRDQDLPFEKSTWKTNKVVDLFRKRGLSDKEQLFHYRISSTTNIYTLGSYSDYNYGYMVPRSSCLQLFDLVRYEEGFVLMLPTPDEPDQLPPFAPMRKVFLSQKESVDWEKKIAISTVSDLNRLLVNGSEKEVILVQEAYHERQIAAIARQICEDPKKRIVLIAGPSSSGKTTFSYRLSTQLSVYGLKPHPVAMDDYFVNREDTPKDEDGNYNFECLEALDVPQFNEDMLSLLRGETVELPTFNFKTGRREYRGQTKKLGQGDILVIEGIHGLNPKMAAALPEESIFRIYVCAMTQLNLDEHNRITQTDGRLIRRMVRDARTRGTGASGTIAMWPSVRRGEESYIFPYQERTDVMFNTALLYELSVLKTYAEPLLFGIMPDDPGYPEARRLLKFLDYFVPMRADRVPTNSLLREFIGGGCFDL